MPVATFRVKDPDTPAASFSQNLFERLAIFKIVRYVDLERYVIGRIILRKDLTEKR